MKSFMANPSTVERKWYVVDATGYTLGRLSSEVAKILRGKNKPQFTPHIDTGDYVIITNADKITVTGKKLEQKIYYRHSDYVGGMKEMTLKEIAVGQTVKVKKLTGEGPVKRRIMDMGITKGVDVFVRKVAPLGDPIEVTVRGYELSLRKADAEMIEVE